MTSIHLVRTATTIRSPFNNGLFNCIDQPSVEKDLESRK